MMFATSDARVPFSKVNSQAVGSFLQQLALPGRYGNARATAVFSSSHALEAA